MITVFAGKGGYWARIESRHDPLYMERGPYRYAWMARLAFPIQRWFF